MNTDNERPQCPCGKGRAACGATGHWKIDRVSDHGPAEYYRFHVTGENLFVEPGGYGRRIDWRVPTLENTQYDLSAAKWIVP